MDAIKRFFSGVWDYLQEEPLLSVSAVLGLLAFIILVYLFFRLRHKSVKVAGKKTVSESTSAGDVANATFSPYRVTDIRNAQAEGLSQEAISKLFKGEMVRWRGDLLHARPQGEDLVRISIEFGDVGMFPVVFCTVPLSLYPNLKNMYQGTQVTVQGRISGISDMHVSLDNAVLSLGI